MIVVDASVILELLLATADSFEVRRRLFRRRHLLTAPSLIDAEICRALSRYAQVGELRPARAREAIHDLADLPLRRYPDAALIERAWELTNDVTPFDGLYLALAEALNAPLLTRDPTLAAATGHRATIELVG